VAGADLQVALASAGLFDLLGVQVPRSQERPSLVLSDSAWRTLFGSESPIPGRAIEVEGRRAIIAAVIPADSWQLPRRLDAWLIDDRAVAALPRAAKGFVVGRLAEGQPISFSRGGLDASPLRGYPVFALPAVILIALSVAAATTPARLRGYRSWLFLTGKIALVLPVVFFCTLILQAIAGQEIRPCMVFGYVIAFRWVLLDQQRRCPECLRRLGRPVRIGQPSQTFLDWYGTELACVQGHGLLHVSETPTISFERQRWMPLGRSWTALFR
jgi:hypothetical protein